MPEKLSYILVDDAEIDRLNMEALASDFPFLQQLCSCSHPLEALEQIRALQPDIIFADIEMPGMNGMDMIRAAAGKVPAPVFITSHPEFAVESYEINAFDYLLKPVTAERFARCALRLQDFFALRSNAFSFSKELEAGSIIIKQGHDKCRLQLKEILFVEAMKDYVAIVTEHKKWLVLDTITHMEQKLPGEKFARIHRSYIINLDKIDAWKGNTVRVGHNELPVGKSYKHAFNRRII